MNKPVVAMASILALAAMAHKRRKTRLERFCRRMPKVELHAHLSGSVRPTTLLELAKQRGPEIAAKAERLLRDATPYTRDHRSLSECFEIFELIHALIDTAPILRRVTREVLEDFAADGVCYLELRTTPRALKDGTDAAGYVEAVLSEIQAFHFTAAGDPGDAAIDFNASLGAFDTSIQPPPPAAAAAAASVFSAEDAGQQQQRRRSMTLSARLILSIDRAQGPAQASEVAALALAHHHGHQATSGSGGGSGEFSGGSGGSAGSSGNGGGSSGTGGLVVGLDLSGNPTKGCAIASLAAALQDARVHGLPLTVHCGEVKGKEAEMDSVLAMKPQRLGHALYLTPAQVALVQASKVPIELCPTSNLKTLGLESLVQHPTAHTWLTGQHPFSVNTDDSGVFATCSSDEHALLFDSLGAPPPVAAAVTCAAVTHAFCGQAMKEWLQKSMREECKRLCALDSTSLGLY